MNCWLDIERSGGIDRRDVDVHPQGLYGTADGACPGCHAEPFRIQCEPIEPVDSHTDRAGGRCMNCNDPVGWVYCDRSTIFGREQDREVIEFGRARVYGLESPR
jgi:hypothetical protein